MPTDKSKPPQAPAESPKPAQCPLCHSESEEEAADHCTPTEGECPISLPLFLNRWPSQAEFDGYNKIQEEIADKMVEADSSESGGQTDLREQSRLFAEKFSAERTCLTWREQSYLAADVEVFARQVAKHAPLPQQDEREKFENWLNRVAAANPAGLADSFISAARAGWQARAELRAHAPHQPEEK